MGVFELTVPLVRKFLRHIATHEMRSAPMCWRACSGTRSME
jgi:hypothetical protein